MRAFDERLFQQQGCERLDDRGCERKQEIERQSAHGAAPSKPSTRIPKAIISGVDARLTTVVAKTT